MANQLLNWSSGDSSGSIRARVSSLDSKTFTPPFEDSSLESLHDRAKALQETREDSDALKLVLKRLRELPYPEGGGPVVDILQDLLEQEPSPEVCGVLWRIGDDTRGSVEHSSELLAVAISLVHSLRRCRDQTSVWSLGAWFSLSTCHSLAMAQAGLLIRR